jgi:TetR/AcrR family transcriptional regulator
VRNYSKCVYRLWYLKFSKEFCLIKTTRKQQKEEIIMQIVLAAEYLFGTMGHRGTSIQRVASEVGISKQALMHHFPTKSSLRTAVFANVVTYAQEFLGVLLININHPNQEQQLADLIQKFSSRPYWAQFLLRELLDGGSDELPVSVHRIFMQFVEYLEEEQSKGRIPSQLDVEATLANLNLLLLSTLATFDSTPLPKDDIKVSTEEWMCRRIQEVFRLYRVTLFAS